MAHATHIKAAEVLTTGFGRLNALSPSGPSQQAVSSVPASITDAIAALKALPLTDMAAAIREALFDRSYSYGFDQVDAGLDRIIAEDDGPGVDIRRTAA